MSASAFNELETEVLFQKIGHLWYVFAEVQDEVIYTALPIGVDPHNTSTELFEIIEDHIEKVAEFQTGRPKDAAL